MSTNNFSFENICVVVHDNTDDGDNAEIMFDEDVAYWKDELKSKIKGCEIPSKPNWIDEAYILAEIPFYHLDELYAKIYITYQSGYYSAACLDYKIRIEDEYNPNKSINRDIQRKCNKIVKVLSKLGTRVLKVAQFSNGEAVYRRA